MVVLGVIYICRERIDVKTVVSVHECKRGGGNRLYTHIRVCSMCYVRKVITLGY